MQPANTVAAPEQHALASTLAPHFREGFRIFGKVACAMITVAATAAAVVLAGAIFPALAAAASTALSSVPLAATVSIIVISLAAAAVSLFGMERLGRSSALDSVGLAQTEEENLLNINEGVTEELIAPDALQNAADAQAIDPSVTDVPQNTSDLVDDQ